MSTPWYGRSPFPNRADFAAPDSGIVQSDTEWNKAWTDRIKSIPQYLDPVATGMSTPWWQSANINSLTASGGGPRGAYSDTEKLANSFGITLTQDANNGGFMIGRAPDIQMEYAPAAPNPEYARITNDYANAQKYRGENQIRQQQAYDTILMGNNAQNGVLPSNYADPNYGQVTGQKVGGLGGLGGADLTGVSEQPSAGAFGGGFGSYNPTPWTPGNIKSGGWNGF